LSVLRAFFITHIQFGRKTADPLKQIIPSVFLNVKTRKHMMNIHHFSKHNYIEFPENDKLWKLSEDDGSTAS